MPNASLGTADITKQSNVLVAQRNKGKGWCPRTEGALTYLWTKKWAHWVILKKASVGTVSGPQSREFWGIEFTFKRAEYTQIYLKASCPGAWVEGQP